MSNRDIMSGQTMFDYLQRKKRAVLEKTVSRSKVLPSDFDRSRLRASDCTEALDKTSRNRSRDTCHELTDKNQAKGEVHATGRRAPLVDEERGPATRSFLQMISPIRSKSPLQKEAEKMLKSPRLGKKDSYKENYTKRIMQEKMGGLRDLVDSLVRSGRVMKEKFHFLSVELQPFLRHVEHCDSSKLERKTEVIRAQLKAVEQNFREFSLENAEKSSDSFFASFSQYVNELQGQAIAEIQSTKEGRISEIERSMKAQLTDLQDQLKGYEKELVLARKENDRLLKGYESLEASVTAEAEKRESLQRQGLRKAEAGLQREQQANIGLREEVEELSRSLSERQEDAKRLLYEREKYQEECFNTINKIKTEQEEFLLSEIMALKKEFSIDIAEMAKLAKIKEDEYLFRLGDISAEKDKLAAQLERVARSNVEIEERGTGGLAQAERLRRQNEMLATDLHRLNEELYQHWLALKDIRTLSMRLETYPKFKMIYEEMLFNEQLFL